MGANLHARWRLAGPQNDGHRTAVFGVVNMDRQEAALIVMGVEQRQLLMAVHNIASVVDVQNNRRRLVRVRRHPLIDQRVGEADRILQRRPVLQPRQRRLRTQVRAAVGQPPAGELERWIGAQTIQIVPVFIAARDREDARADHVGERMSDP